MPVHSIPELLIHELGDLLFAERTILKALRSMIRDATVPDMRARLEEHYTETEGQIRNIERAFEALGERAKGQKCPGILVGSSRVDLQACKLEYSIVSPK